MVYSAPAGTDPVDNPCSWTVAHPVQAAASEYRTTGTPYGGTSYVITAPAVDYDSYTVGEQAALHGSAPTPTPYP